MTRFELGDTIREKITGFEGVAVGRHYFISGTVQYTIAPKKLDDKGSPVPIASFDWQHLELMERGPLVTMPTLPEFELGDEVDDEITDFKGTVTSKSEFINGCVQYGVQPRALAKDGDMVKPRLVDCQRLVLRGRRVGRVQPQPGGGPERMPV